LLHSAAAPRHLQAKARSAAAYFAMSEGAADEAIDHLRHSIRLFRPLRDPDGLSFALSRLGRFLAFRGDTGGARSAAEEALLVARRYGSEFGLRKTLHNVGETMRDLGERDRAEGYIREGLRLNVAAGDEWQIFSATHSLADLALEDRNAPNAWQLYLEALRAAAQLGDERNAAPCLAGLAAAAALQGQKVRASKLWGAALARERHVGMQMLSFDRERYTPLLTDLDAPAVEHGLAWEFAAAVAYASADGDLDEAPTAPAR
jgi:tetratricopeptide (TPR) repeat protein